MVCVFRTMVISYSVFASRYVKKLDEIPALNTHFITRAFEK